MIERPDTAPLPIKPDIDQLWDELANDEPKVFTTGQVAKICGLAERTVAKRFDNGTITGYRKPGSRKRWFPRNHLLDFLKAQYGVDGLRWLQRWERHSALIFTAEQSTHFNPALLEQARAVLLVRGFSIHAATGLWEAALAFGELPNCWAVAIIVPVGAKLPAGFLEPTESNENPDKDRLILYEGHAPVTVKNKPKGTSRRRGGVRPPSSEDSNTVQRYETVMSSSPQVFYLQGVSGD